MFLVPVNYIAVLLSAVASVGIGFLWYGPLLGKKWMKLSGVNEKKMNESMPKGMNMNYILSFLSYVVIAYVLWHFIWFTSPGTVTLTIGVKTALWAWVGFVATTGASKYIWNVDNKPWERYLFDNCYYLVTLVVMGVLLSLSP